ncbi:MAG: hypothetical protein HKO66_14560 [Saprospiraceae bacterium]|nr:hypothetical protein [Bacteroidia bacterium]NNE16488.1 hypothetical protein [Saprospiraceae bacterium]NNL93460.1 hypothetical protein [Saprospiraceae bacterium]
MKNTLILLVFLLASNVNYAQINAVTEVGEEVILYEDGTWIFKNGDPIETQEIPLNPTEFSKSDNAGFLLKSEKIDKGFYINPKKWMFKKGEDGTEAEYDLQMKDGDLYGMIISEKIQIPLLSLRQIALENGRSVAPDLKIVKEEYRMVNGMKLLYLQMNGTTQGIKFSYVGYYHSDEGGTLQFVTYTSQNLIDEYQSVCEELLNGFVELN